MDWPCDSVSVIGEVKGTYCWWFLLLQTVATGAKVETVGFGAWLDGEGVGVGSEFIVDAIGYNMDLIENGLEAALVFLTFL